MSTLSVAHISKSFGGLPVLSDVSFDIAEGDRVALIGPNGAGKTTLINVLSGIFPATSGAISQAGVRIEKMPAHRRVALGFSRSFQLNSLFTDLDVMANVLLAIQGTQKSRFRVFSRLYSHQENVATARRLLESVGLSHAEGLRVAELSHGQQRQVEIVMALAVKPTLLLLDEPSAGLTAGESSHLAKTLRSLPATTSVLFSAHDLDLVFSLATKIIVLHQGEVVAQNTPQSIRDDPTVRAIYLGKNIGAKRDA